MMSFGDPAKYVTNLYIDEECLDDVYAQEIIQNSGLPVQVVRGPVSEYFTGEYPHNLSSGKHHLYLCRNRGKFFKECPGTKEYNCCGYQVLNIGMNCPMDCVYCILQAYLNNPWLSFFVNVNDLFIELDEAGVREQDNVFRIGTGEFTDSLALDSITGLSRHLVDYFSRAENSILELKTKSAVIGNLADLDHGGNTVVAWSLNSPVIMRQEEIRTATLDERLAAARQCVEWGYRLAFHFDPIIWHNGWEEGYAATIRKLFNAVPADSIAWISMGALRYLPPLKTIATSRFPGSRFFFEEFVEGLDGKARYFRSQRVEMYKLIAGEIKKYMSEKTCLYFCMESDAIWKEVLGFSPAEQGGLAAMLDRTV